jgi:t-SNARE complex subunit (syntaxin)
MPSLTYDGLDNIESNIVSVAQNTSSAADELTTAHEYQRKAGRRMACLLVILVIVIAVILLAVSVGVYRRGYDS